MIMCPSKPIHNTESNDLGCVSSRRQPVVVFDCETGDLIGEYASATEASLVLGVSGGNISSVLNRRFRQTGGFVFRYPDEEFTPDDVVVVNRPVRRAIVAYHRDRGSRHVYDSAAECARELFGVNSNHGGTIRDSAASPHNWKKTVHGYYFFFVGEEPNSIDTLTFARRGRKSGDQW